MASTSDFRTGLILVIDGNLFSITEFQHVKMGRGSAFVRTKLKNYKTGRVVEKTFRAGEKVNAARVERRKMQYLYREGDALVLMDNESYDQLSVETELLQSGLDLLKEGDTVDVLMHGDTPIGLEMPNFVVLEITSTEPGVKGDTVSGATKKAVLETGGSVQVPLFLEEGEKIKVDTRTGEYIERVK
ncbi:MAG: elongation factor P [Calditrichaeota bacterium]|nr:elongation factor P [Actinomycetota bacterium]NOY58054.1 elongation factor P [Calditrichota bacterium]